MVINLRWRAIIVPAPGQIVRTFQRGISLTALFRHLNVNLDTMVQRAALFLNGKTSFFYALVLNEPKAFVDRTA